MLSRWRLFLYSIYNNLILYEMRTSKFDFGDIWSHKVKKIPQGILSDVLMIRPALHSLDSGDFFLILAINLGGERGAGQLLRTQYLSIL